MIKSRCISIQSAWRGLQNYQDVDQEQKSLVRNFLDSLDVKIWGLEFNPVITLGKRGLLEKDVLRAAMSSSAQPLPVLQTDRGGQATLHSPGQLVIFPMMDIKNHRIGVRDLTYNLLLITQKTLRDFSINSTLSLENAGLYTERGKIAFIGLRVDQGVVRHGLSLNVCNDLSLFEQIIPCGFKNASLDSIYEFQTREGKVAFSKLNPERVFEKWSQNFNLEHFICH